MSIPVITEQEKILLLSPGLTHEKSELLCRCSILSYDEDFDALKNAAARNFDNFDAWLTKDDNHSNQGFAMWDDGVAVIAFRGTDQGRDWKKNSEAFFPDKNELRGRAHDGFTDVYREQQDRVLEILHEKIRPGTRLWICGHSLGGALATALSAELLVRKPENIEPDWYVSTIGGARYGNKKFVKAYDTLMENRHWFYANENDVVPHLGPKALGYRHVGELTYFNKEGEYVPVSKEDVGLQFHEEGMAAEARKEYELLDQEVNRHADTEAEYKAFLAEVATEDWILAEAEALALGGLQGDSLWFAKAHSSFRYWQNIRTLAAL